MGSRLLIHEQKIRKGKLDLMRMGGQHIDKGEEAERRDALNERDTTEVVEYHNTNIHVKHTQNNTIFVLLKHKLLAKIYENNDM